MTMKIDKEVMEAVFNVDYNCDPEDEARHIINTYLKSVWVPFDNDDETTYPEKFKHYFVIKFDGSISRDEWWDVASLGKEWLDGEVIAYLDPADILPEGEE